MKKKKRKMQKSIERRKSHRKKENIWSKSKNSG